mgnify:CR=1 FL=1
MSYFFANFRRCLEAVLALKYFFILLFIIIYVYTSYPELLFNIEGLTYAYIATLRFIVLILLFSLFISTTNLMDLTYTLTKMGLPYEVAFTLTLSIRFVPTIARDIQSIYDAQRSRGLELEKGNIFKRIRNLTAILIPAFTTTLLRVDRVAEALESRAFGAVKNRTYLYQTRISRLDILFLAITIIIVLCLYYLNSIVQFLLF